MTSLLTKIKILDTQVTTNTQNISNKQNTLTAGTNISISNNTISSIGSITQAQLTTELNKKQNNLNIYDNIILNSLYVAPFSTKTTTSPAINGEVRSKI